MLRLLTCGMWCALCIGLASAHTNAQTTPQQTPQTAGKNPVEAPAAPVGEMSRDRTGDTGRSRSVSPYWGETGDLPAEDIRAVPSASAAAVEARWIFNQSMVDLANATRLLTIQIEQEPGFAQALREEKQAYETLAQVRRTALASLLENPSYTGAEQLRMNLSRQIAEEFEQDKPDFVRIDAMARLKLDYGRENRQLEQSVLERDAEHTQARNRYIEAANVVRDLRSRQAMTIATDEGLSDLRRQIAGARITKLAATAYLRGMVQARNLAIDYAQFYRAYDRRPYYSPYGYTSIYGNNYGARN
jgi:hypothetical protein